MALESLDQSTGADTTQNAGGLSTPNFDRDFYLAQNPDVAQNWGGDPYQHYLSHGQKEGRLGMAPTPSAPMDQFNIASPNFNVGAFFQQQQQQPSAVTPISQINAANQFAAQTPVNPYAGKQITTTTGEVYNYDDIVRQVNARYTNDQKTPALAVKSGIQLGIPEEVMLTLPGITPQALAEGKRLIESGAFPTGAAVASPTDDPNAMPAPAEYGSPMYNARIAAGLDAYGWPAEQVAARRAAGTYVEPPGAPQQQQAAPTLPGQFTDTQVAAYIKAHNLSGQGLTDAMDAFGITPTQLQNAQALISSNDPRVDAANEAYRIAAAQNPNIDQENLAVYNPATGEGSIAGSRPALQAVLSATIGADLVNKLTPEQLSEYNRLYNTSSANENDRLLGIYGQIAKDPVLGAELKASNPFLYEAATPLTLDNSQLKSYARGHYGQYGTYNIGGADVPILNAKTVDNLLGVDQFGSISDFSHDRGNLTRDLGWSSNSLSNKIARGAEAIGVTTMRDDEGNVSFQGLDEAARMLGLDTSQFQDKQVESTTTDEFGNTTPVMQTISRDQQLYDAINQNTKDLYLYTGDSLTPGNAREGGAKSFDSVLYRRSGDELIPITAPTSHGGVQNMDIYRPKNYGFGYYAQGPAFVAAAALSFAMADPTLSLATAVGSAMLPAAAATTIGATATGVVGSVVLGAAAGALSSTAAGIDPGKGALTGAVTGLVASSMKPLLSSQPMLAATESIANASQGLFSQAQVGNIIGATLASTLASTASGANGNQILNSFTTALISSGLSEKAAQLAVAGVKEAFGDDPKTLARTAAATRLVARTASTAALSGRNPEQIQAAVIATLVQNAASIANAGSGTTTKQKTTQVSSAEYDGLVDALGGKEQADAYLAGLKQDTGASPYAPVAGVGDTPLVKDPKSSVTVTSVNDIDPNAPAVKQQALTPEEEIEYQKEVAEQDARIAQQDADKVSKVANAIALPNADISSMVSVITNMFRVPQKTAAIAANMAKSGATATQISKVIGTSSGTTPGAGGGTGGGTDSGAGGGGGTDTGGGGTSTTPSTGGDGTGGDGTGGSGTGGSGTGGSGGGARPTTPTRPVTIPQMRASQAAEETSGIYNLTPGLTRAKTDYQLAGQFKMAAGGAVATQYDPFGLEKSNYGTSDSAGISDPSASPFVGSSLKMPKLRVGMTKRNVDYNLAGYNPKFMAEGGAIQDHNPQFFSEGGLGSLENRYVNGEGNGTSDEVPAMLANGEFVIPADVVASLGNGSNEAGAGVLDQFLQTIREHRQNHDSKELPPDSKGPLAYLLEAKKRA